MTPLKEFAWGTLYKHTFLDVIDKDTQIITNYQYTR